MSGIMRPIPFAKLMEWALQEYQAHGTIFGVNALYKADRAKALPIFSEKLELPFGPAAGPHTQLAQNLVASYAAGARFFELKTVQTIDGENLHVSKPCILAEDEGYNVEWSTELRVGEAFDEYVKGWFALKLLSEELGLGASDAFVFNMSVGYDLEGIKSPKIDEFIEGMKRADGMPIWQECMDWAERNLHRFKKLDTAFLRSIDSKVCKSITLSTLHGCPPDEIERIASYLIGEKKLNTYVKCNPTLLGYEFARKTLDGMGYDYLAFDDHHFNNDLRFEDAVPMFERLLRLAADHSLEFGLKLTNTFPVKIVRGELPGEEMYMSGRPLFPLTISLAEKIERAFDGKLRVSFSGGADQFNIARIFECGIWPITLATTLLKPGGYNRLHPMAQELGELPFRAFEGVDLDRLAKLAADAKTDPHHLKPVKTEKPRKLEAGLPLVDCFIAPCSEGCPIHQDIPSYLELVGQGRYSEALGIVLEKNPLPFITGTICGHRCMSECARNFYEEPVQIRAAKLLAAQRGLEQLLPGLAPSEARAENVAIIGGGPAGMAAAFLIARAGAKATIFEKRADLGGIVRHAIPAFRIEDAAVDNDEKLLRKLGVTVKLNTEVTDADALLRQGYTHVIVAVGASKPGELKLASGEAMNALKFLEAQKKRPGMLNLGANVVVIGGGNTAMDAARAAKRVRGVVRVSLVYRRTVRQMPADAEELELALGDGVEFLELLAPVSHEGGLLKCEVMELGVPDASGRCSPVGTGAFAPVLADTVISATGEQVDGEQLKRFGVLLNERGRADAVEAGDRLFVIGDALRGPASVVEAIADATECARRILSVEPQDAEYRNDADMLKSRRGKLRHSDGPADEKERCLGCPMVCGNCVDACPNRANILVVVPGMEREQMLHIDRMCNECGNCTAFCPYAGSPYKDKFTIFGDEREFEGSENPGFVVLDRTEHKVRVRLNGEAYDTQLWQDKKTYPALVEMMKAVISDYAWVL